jgi:hypothetical protein
MTSPNHVRWPWRSASRTVGIDFYPRHAVGAPNTGCCDSSTGDPGYLEAFARILHRAGDVGC